MEMKMQPPSLELTYKFDINDRGVLCEDCRLKVDGEQVGAISKLSFEASSAEHIPLLRVTFPAILGLNPELQAKIDRQAELLRKVPGVTVTVGG
jgi:hypothetical protein